MASNRKSTIAGLGMLLALSAGWAPRIWACSATDALDAAKDVRSEDNDTYQSARDVARSLVRDEGYLERDIVIEAGAGTLLFDKSRGEFAPDVFRTSEDWAPMLDTAGPGVNGLHGMSRDKVASVGVGTWATCREHMRLHIDGLDRDVRDGGIAQAWQWRYGVDAAGNFPGTAAPVATSSASEPNANETPTQTAEPAPSSPTPVVAPPAAPAPIVHHAG